MRRQLPNIEELLEQTQLEQDNDLIFCEIAVVSPIHAALILEKSGIQTTGFFHIIDNYLIRHTKLRHGNSEIEAQHGQIAVQPEDFLFLPSILLEFDVIHYEFGRNKHTLIYKKYIGERLYVYAAEIRSPKRRMICGQSLRILRIKKAAPE